MNFYRFSVSWPRVLPDGDISSLNMDGIRYYNNLIDLLLRNNIEPIITMYHFDLPQMIQNYGGFLNPNLINYFEQYANLLFKYFGDRVSVFRIITMYLKFKVKVLYIPIRLVFKYIP